MVAVTRASAYYETTSTSLCLVDLSLLIKRLHKTSPAPLRVGGVVKCQPCVSSLPTEKNLKHVFFPFPIKFLFRSTHPPTPLNLNKGSGPPQGPPLYRAPQISKSSDKGYRHHHHHHYHHDHHLHSGRPGRRRGDRGGTRHQAKQLHVRPLRDRQEGGGVWTVPVGLVFPPLSAGLLAV